MDDLDELTIDLLMPTEPRSWRRQTGNHDQGRLASLLGPRVFGNARWKKDWVKVSKEFAQARRACGDSVRDLVSPICRVRCKTYS